MLASSGLMTPRTQKVTFGLRVRLGNGGVKLWLIFAVNGNMYMSHGAIDRCPEGRAAECRAQLAGAWNGHGGRGGVAVSPVRALAAPGIPLPSRSAGDRSCGAVGRTVGADHAEDTSECGARCAGLFGDQRL